MGPLNTARYMITICIHLCAGMDPPPTFHGDARMLTSFGEKITGETPEVRSDKRKPREEKEKKERESEREK